MVSAGGIASQIKSAVLRLWLRLAFCSVAGQIKPSNAFLPMATAPCKISAGITKKFIPRASGNCTFHSFGSRNSGFEFSPLLCFLAPLFPSGYFDMHGWGQRELSFLLLNFETIAL
ncbi:hypothetical protein K438DRAFT_365199 [Mycena galopus ATCC 62051]|nr:hypothetical protein K438DRAFT_365199 [Mycena galopus ATCC 62051]